MCRAGGGGGSGGGGGGGGEARNTFAHFEADVVPVCGSCLLVGARVAGFGGKGERERLPIVLTGGGGKAMMRGLGRKFC